MLFTVSTLLRILAASAASIPFVAAQTEITTDELYGNLVSTAAPAPGFNVDGGSVFANFVNAFNDRQLFFLTNLSLVYEKPGSELVSATLLWWCSDLTFSGLSNKSLIGYAARCVEMFLAGYADHMASGAQSTYVYSEGKFGGTRSISAVYSEQLNIFQGQVHHNTDDFVFRFWDDGRKTMPLIGWEGHDEGDMSANAATSSFSSFGEITWMSVEEVAQLFNTSTDEFTPDKFKQVYEDTWIKGHEQEAAEKNPNPGAELEIVEEVKDETDSTGEPTSPAAPNTEDGGSGTDPANPVDDSAGGRKLASVAARYLINDSVNKRTWAIIVGCVFTPIAFVPTFRHFRLLSVFGILTTTYIAWYMTITAVVQGPSETTTYSAPSSLEQYMLGIVALLFTYGGHTSNIEVADVMNNPASYDQSYFWSYLYVFTLTMPNAVAAYHTFGDLCIYNANAIALYSKTPARDVGLALMVIHEMVAFGLFAGPLFHMWEKFLHIHDRPFAFRAMCRVPLCGVIVFLAVAFPFFGAINAVIGAFGTSFGTYIIPALGFNLAFKSGENLIKQCYFSFKAVRMINWLIVIFIGFLGVGYGGYTSIKSFIAQINEYEVFAECYQCDTDGKLQMPPGGVDTDYVSEEG